MTAWNAEVWREEFEAAATGARRGDPEAMDRLRELRVEVFENTLETLCTGGYETPSGKEISLPDPESLAAGAVFYREAFEAAGSDPLSEGTAVTVENLDCLLAAERLKREGLNPAVLNMANRRTPGGGVAYGAGAQEENLCRRTALYPTLERFADSDSPDCYPMDPDFGGIYSPDVPVIRTGESRGCAWLEEPFTVSFISVAAINRPALTPEGRLTPAMVAGTKNKIRTILRIGLHHRHDALVLGALGCGAFRNPPDHVAELFKEVLNEPEFKDRFRRIVFAIIEDHNSRRRHNPRGNLLPFQECFATATPSMNDSIEDKRERENREIFESLAKVVHIILTKCNRCNPTYGCMGCEFDPLGGPIVPLVEEAFLSFADHHNVPPHLEHLYRKILSHSKKRDTFLK